MLQLCNFVILQLVNLQLHKAKITWSLILYSEEVWYIVLVKVSTLLSSKTNTAVTYALHHK